MTQQNFTVDTGLTITTNGSDGPILDFQASGPGLANLTTLQSELGPVSVFSSEFVELSANNINWTFDDTGNLTLPGNTFAVNYANGTAVSLGSNYGNANVANFLGNYGSNTIVTTGNITAANFVGNINITGNVIGTQPNVTLVAGSYSTVFDNTGVATFPGNISAGNIGVSETVTARTLVTDPGPLSGLTATFGARAFINDGNLAAAGNFGAQVSGGAGNSVPVWSDGTNWYIG